MSIKTFWNILLKVLGIFLLLGVFQIIVQLAATIPFIWDRHEFIPIIIAVLLIVAVFVGYFFLIRAFFFAPAWLNKILRLDQGFTEERIDLNIKTSAILRIAVVVVGGVVFIQSFPELCRQIFIVYQQKVALNVNAGFQLVIICLVKLVIGYLLVANNKRVADFISKKADDGVEEEKID
ncbi:hypothetical protein D0T49_08890 [Paludibacter sp. 221]|uniref:hypothetical protein n=1 Tax=Paludibacter sp. 221 TaxID=2302939 RepID=UPI0013D79E99|nr:hypothetical protein [Paludibacter sp. 221]NDV47159.1 hypothetical protein [Paludibacter sp. 221]